MSNVHASSYPKTSKGTSTNDPLALSGPPKTSQAVNGVNGLAIFYDHQQSPFEQQAPSSFDMGFLVQSDIPSPPSVASRTPPLEAAFPDEEGGRDRADSVFDAYASIFDDYALDDESSPAVPSAPSTPPLVDLPAQRLEPWDTRGKTGLYGGGGRGADDRETGWVGKYAVVKEASCGGGAEEELHHEEAPRRRSSSGTDHSSYGPVTPVGTAFDPMVQSQDSYGKPIALTPHPANLIHPAESEPPKLSETRPTTSPAPAASNTLAASPVVAIGGSKPVVPARYHPLHLSLSMRLKKKSPSVRLGQQQSSSAPGAGVEGMKRRKSLVSTLKWSRSKKAPTISHPILPDGFVESLGMDTFALNSGHAPPEQPTPKSKKEKTNSQTREPPFPSPSAVIPVTRPPELVRTPLDALREAGASTPQDVRRTEVSDAVRPLSHDSSYSSAPSTIAAVEDRLHRLGIGATDEPPLKAPLALGAPASVPVSSLAQQRPILASSLAQQRPISTSTTRQSSPRSVLSPLQSEFISVPEPPQWISKDNADDPWTTTGRPSVDSVATTDSGSNYNGAYDGYSSAVDRSPDDASDHSNFSLEDRMGHTSESSKASPGGFSPERPFETFEATFQGQNYKSMFLPAPASGVDGAKFSALPGSTIRRGSSVDIEIPAGAGWTSQPKPIFNTHAASSSSFAGGGMIGQFRNPFQAMPPTGPRQSGWQ